MDKSTAYTSNTPPDKNLARNQTKRSLTDLKATALTRQNTGPGLAPSAHVNNIANNKACGGGE